MLKIVNATSPAKDYPNGVEICSILFEVPDEEGFNIEEAARKAAKDFLASEESRSIAEVYAPHTDIPFSWSDFSLYVPDKFMMKYGFKTAPHFYESVHVEDQVLLGDES